MQMKVLMLQNGNVFQEKPVTLPNLEFGVYDGVAHWNIRMKAAVLIYDKQDNFVPVVYMLKWFK